MICTYPCKCSAILINTYMGSHEPSLKAYHYNTKVISIYVDDDTNQMTMYIDTGERKSKTTKKVIYEAIKQYCDHSINYGPECDALIDFFNLMWKEINSNIGYTTKTVGNVTIDIFY